MAGVSRNRTGFTLIELLLVLTMLAIVITVGAPSFGGFIKENRVKSGARAVAVAVQTARLKAISGNRRCYLDFASGAYTPADSFFTLWLDSNSNQSYDSGEIDSTKLALPDTKGSFRGFKLPRGVKFGLGSGAGLPASGPEGGVVPASGVDFSGANKAWFNSRGEGAAGLVVLTGENGSIYAVSVSALGGVRIWRWEDNQWK